MITRTIACRWIDQISALEAGLSEADEIVELHLGTAPVHQGHVEPHACIAEYNADGTAHLSVSCKDISRCAT